MALSTSEEIFIKRFIERPLRERWLKRLGSAKTRHKQVNRLAHTFVHDLDQRYVYDKDNPPPAVAAQIQQMLTAWKKANPQQLCSIIALGSDLDGQMLS